MTYKKSALLEAARSARSQAYAPYSHFLVGAALLDSEGNIHPGCNVENLSYGLTLCAERNALVSAIARGQRNFIALALVADTKIPLSPCGACRQVLAEFAPELVIVTGNLRGDEETLSLKILLPRAKTGILDHP
jgi:cytidine deaminase